MIWLLIVMCTVSICECFLQMPFSRNAKTLVLYASKSYRVISSDRISDIWKERSLPIFAAKIFRTSLVLFWFLLLSFLPVVLWQFLAGILGLELFAILVELPGMLVMTATGVLYFYLRKKLSHD